MAYLKKQLDEKDRDNMRINLSVQPKKISPEPVCDFCGSNHPRVVYAASRMSTGEIRNCWRWTACGVCESLIDSGQWREVELRIENWLLRSYKDANLPIPKDLLQLAVKASLEQFHKYALGV